MGNKKGYFPFVSDTLCDFRDKERNANYYVRQMLARSQSMFRYENLPDTIPQKFLEMYLQTNGNAAIAEVNGELYAFTGGLGGEPDAYYRPTLYTVANPALNLSKSYKIDEDCVLIWGDSLGLGLLPMFKRYASLLVENELSLLLADINLRTIAVLTAEDERTAEAAKIFLADIEKGKQGVVAQSTLIGGFNSVPYVSSGSSSIMTQLIEFEQYLKANWYNDIGIQSNYNMKRAQVTADETQLQYDSLLPLIDDMLKCREEGVEKINKMFNTNISVSLNSVWEDRQEKIDLSIDEAEQLRTQETQDGKEGGQDFTVDRKKEGE